MPFEWRINITKNPKKGQPAIFKFEETPQVAVGDTILWSNQDKIAHWPGIAGNNTAFMANQIASHSTSTAFTPGQPGTITYICTLPGHEGEGGVINVAAPAPPPKPGVPPAGDE